MCLYVYPMCFCSVCLDAPPVLRRERPALPYHLANMAGYMYVFVCVSMAAVCVHVCLLCLLKCLLSAYVPLAPVEVVPYLGLSKVAKRPTRVTALGSID